MQDNSYILLKRSNICLLLLFIVILYVKHYSIIKRRFSQHKKTNPNGSPAVIQAGGETKDRASLTHRAQGSSTVSDSKGTEDTADVPLGWKGSAGTKGKATFNKDRGLLRGSQSNLGIS